MEIQNVIMHLGLIIMSAFAFYQYIINRKNREEYRNDAETLRAIYAILEKVTDEGRYDRFLGGLHYNNVYQQAVDVQQKLKKLKSDNEELAKENIRLRQLEAQVIPLESVGDYQRKISSLSLQLEDLLHAKIDEITIKPYCTYDDYFKYCVDKRGYHLHMVVDGKEITEKVD